MLAVGHAPEKGSVLSEALKDPPAWVADAVVYEVFPDRFRRGARVPGSGAAVGLQWTPWGANPALQGFQGGDLWGVLESLEYLQDLGITCLYLTPIFSSAANHRYHAYDYRHVDPLLGGDEALDALVAALHRRGMRLILDGVFNHCGRGFWAFHHLLENGATSPYRDWFQIHQWPLRAYPAPGESCGYSCWWNDPALPKFNHAHPPVRDYLLEVGRHWLERGIDGWRLDVPDEVPSDFWVSFRTMARSVNPEAWIVGEIWGDASAWLQGDQFDGVMNYRLGWSSICWAAAGCLNRQYRNPLYPLTPLGTDEMLTIWGRFRPGSCSSAASAHLNLLDSHDVPRALHSLQGDVAALKIALLLLVCHPGAPCLYYGTEAGLRGGEEPGCREAMPWDGSRFDELSAFLRRLFQLRRQHDVLRTGALRWTSLGDDGLLASVPGFALAINRSRDQSLDLHEHLVPALRSAWGGSQLICGVMDDRPLTAREQSAVLITARSR